MAFRSEWKTKFHRFFESATQESVPMAPVMFYDDFYYLDTTNAWTGVDVADGTLAHGGDGANGTVTMTLAATSEKESVGIHFNDDRVFALDHGPNFEIYCNPTVLPTLKTEIYFGLCGDYVEGPIAEADAGPAEHLFFCMDGGGAVTIHTDDGTTDNDAVSTGVTLTASDWAVFRIDATTPTDIRFYINGSRVASGTTFSANASSTLALQPHVMVHKESGEGLGTLTVDYIRVWSDRT